MDPRIRARLAREALRAAFERELEMGAREIMGEAVRQAPVDEGTLRGAATTEVRREGDDVVAEIRFSSPYAAVQHEHTEYRHPKGGKAKYLQDPLQSMGKRVVDNAAAVLRRKL